MLNRALSKAALLALVIAAGAPVDARAAPSSTAIALYDDGEFVAAANDAGARPNAENLAFAAQALLAQCMTTSDRGQISALLSRAERAARGALDLDANSVDARLQLALIYGVRGKQASIPDAIRRNYAPRGRRLIEEAIALSPRDARAHAMLGAWHFEVLRRGGRLIYGARLREGRAAFERALALDPRDPMIPLHYAVALMGLDAAANAERVTALLRTAAALPPHDALEIYARDTALRLARTLNHDGPRAAAQAAIATNL